MSLLCFWCVCADVRTLFFVGVWVICVWCVCVWYLCLVFGVWVCVCGFFVWCLGVVVCLCKGIACLLNEIDHEKLARFSISERTTTDSDNAQPRHTPHKIHAHTENTIHRHTKHKIHTHTPNAKSTDIPKTIHTHTHTEHNIHTNRHPHKIHTHTPNTRQFTRATPKCGR